MGFSQFPQRVGESCFVSLFRSASNWNRSFFRAYLKHQNHVHWISIDMFAKYIFVKKNELQLKCSNFHFSSVVFLIFYLLQVVEDTIV